MKQSWKVSSHNKFYAWTWLGASRLKIFKINQMKICFVGSTKVITWINWKKKLLETIKKHNKTHNLHADIIKTFAAHGAMRSGAAGATYRLYAAQNIFFTLGVIAYFPQVTQLDKGSFCIPGKALYNIGYLFALSKFSPVAQFVPVKK